MMNEESLLSRLQREKVAWILLTLILLIAVPLFLRMPPTLDVAFYEICARTVLHGGILERDVLYINTPGTVWLFTGIEWLFDAHIVALRVFDLFMIGAIVMLLFHWCRAQGMSRVGCAWLAVVLFGFYLSTTEWCHCQPDAWMVPPALAALHLRLRQVERLSRSVNSPRSVTSWAALEGFCWGVACLIKPFAVLPGTMCWLLSTWILVRGSMRPARKLLADTVGLLAGGLVVGCAWAAWLWLDGGWPYYLHNFRVWSGQYYSKTLPWTERIVPMFTAPPPWGMVNILAMPYALFLLARVLFSKAEGSQPTSRSVVAESLLAVFYLGWFIGGNFVQSQNHYHLIPAVLVGMALVARPVACPVNGRSVVRLACAGLFLAILASQPAFAPSRIVLWKRCWHEKTSPALWDALALDNRFSPDWQDLDRAACFLKSRQVTDGELTCYSLGTTPLYVEMNLEPSTRFLYLSLVLFMYPEHRSLVFRELQSSRHRFLVSDTREIGMSSKQAKEIQPDQPLALPPRFPKQWASVYPWTEPIVYRAGRYLVHRVK